MVGNKRRLGRSTRIGSLQLNFCDQNVGGPVKIDNIAPPTAPGPLGLRRIDEHWVHAKPADPDIIDRTLGCTELCPRSLPSIPKFDAVLGAASHGHRNEK